MPFKARIKGEKRRRRRRRRSRRERKKRVRRRPTDQHLSVSRHHRTPTTIDTIKIIIKTPSIFRHEISFIKLQLF